MSKWLVLLLPMIFLLAISMGYANTVTIYPTDDSYTDSSNPNTIFGNNDSIQSQGNRFRGFMKWNWTTACAGIDYTKIVSATLYGYSYIQLGYGINLYTIPTSTYNWTEGTITYNNQPSLNYVFLGTMAVTGYSGTEHNVDLTSFVKAQLSGGYDVATFHMEQTSYYVSGIFAKEAGNANLRPKLVIDYNGTLSCNGTYNGSTITEVYVPSFLTNDTAIYCWVHSNIEESISYRLFRRDNETANWTGYGSLQTTVIGANTWTKFFVGDFPLPYEKQYKCVANDSTTSVDSNIGRQTIGYSLGIDYTLPILDVGLGEPQYQLIGVTNNGNYDMYAYAECDWENPSGTHYYPNDTNYANSCKRIGIGESITTSPNRIMDMTGNWTSYSCFVYASNYSDCRIQSLGEQDRIINTETWEVTSLPTITSISITPASPKRNETMTCSVRAITGDERTTVDLVSAYFLVNGNYVVSDSLSNVANNSISTFTLNIANVANNGDNVSCGAFVTRISPFYESDMSYSNTVVVANARVINILTYPEPQIFGSDKTISFQTEIPTISTEIVIEKPNNDIFVYNDGGAGISLTGRTLLFQSGIGTDFDIAGTYKYSIKACNCVESDMNTNRCHEESCAYSLNYPNRNYSMIWYNANNFYLTNTQVTNVTYGQTEIISTHTSQLSTVMKVVITMPDSSTKIFVAFANTTHPSISIKTGNGQPLNQIGTYTADVYSGFGWVRTSDNTSCIDFNECSAVNSTLGKIFIVSAGTGGGGYIENITFNPDVLYIGNDMNMSFDTTNATNFTCISMNLLSGGYKTKAVTSALTTNWVIPFTSGSGDNSPAFITENGSLSFDIISCKVNGTTPCISSATCQMATPSNCEYCLYQYDIPLETKDIGNGIYNITYKKTIAVGETQTVYFQTNPAVNDTYVKIYSKIIGKPNVYINKTTPNTFTYWIVDVPYSEILKAISTNTSIANEDITFSVGAVLGGGFIFSGIDDNGNYLRFSINSSIRLTPETKGQGTIFGEMIGQAVGLSGIYGDMILALMFSSVLACAMGVLSKEPIITILAFLTSLSIFSLAGMLPFWIIVIQVLFAGFLLMRFLSTVFTGND